eukprot:4782092-Amphidinium_carterae.1
MPPSCTDEQERRKMKQISTSRRKESALERQSLALPRTRSHDKGLCGNASCARHSSKVATSFCPPAPKKDEANDLVTLAGTVPASEAAQQELGNLWIAKNSEPSLLLVAHL